MILLPAVDIRDGKAVRLRQGHFDDETVYADDPLEAARSFVEAGARFLHIVDLDGAREGEPANLHHVERITAELDVPVELGGGLRSIASIRRALAAGASRVVLGTAAFTDPDLLDEALSAFTSRILVGVDVRGGMVSVAGWTRETQVRGEDAIRRMQQRGVTRFVYTNVDRDGMLEGPDLDEVRRVSEAVRGALPLLRWHRLDRGPARAGRDAAPEPRGRDLRQGALRGALRGPRGPGGARRLMLLRRVIPCLDVDKGRVVKGVEFVNLRDAGDPVELAVRYQEEGADEIVFLDITASHEKRETVAQLARRCADDVFIPFTIGGGVRSVEDAQAVLDAGADKVSINSAAVARPELLSELAEVFGAQCVVLAIDAAARGRRLLRRLRERRPHAGRPRRDRVGARGRGARGGGDPAHEHGPRRHRGRLRAHAHPGGLRRRGRAGDRLGRRGQARSPRGRGGAGRCRRGPVRIDLSLRSPHGARGEGTNARRGDPGEALMSAPPSDLRERVRKCLAWSGCCLRSRASSPPTW